MLEFTGTYYRCYDCGHRWAYEDDACPECGSKNCEDYTPLEGEVIE